MVQMAAPVLRLCKPSKHGFLLDLPTPSRSQLLWSRRCTVTFDLKIADLVYWAWATKPGALRLKFISPAETNLVLSAWKCKRALGMSL